MTRSAKPNNEGAGMNPLEAFSRAFPNEVLRLCIEAEPDLASIPEVIAAEYALEPDIARVKSLIGWIEIVRARCCGSWIDVSQFASDMERLTGIVSSVKDVPSDAVLALAQATQEELSALLKEIASIPIPELPFNVLGPGEPSFDDAGILRWDGLLANRLANIPSAEGEKRASDVIKKAKQRREQWDIDHKATGLWRVWAGPNGYAKLIARAMWPVVKERIEKARGKPAALTMLIHDSAMQLLTQNFKQQEDKNGQRSIVFPDESILRIVTDAATIGTGTLDALMVQKGVELFGTIASHKVFRWQIFTGHRQVLDGNPDPRLLRIEGGWEYFADMLSMSKKQAVQLEQIIEAQHATTLLLPGHDKPSRLLMREYIGHRGRGKAEIRLILGTALLPDFVGELKALKCREAQDWKRLVPITELPPIVGRANEAGGQASLSLLSVCYMRKMAAGLVQQGGVDLLKELPRLASQAGVPQHMIPAIVDRWEQGDNERPAFLLRVGNLHTLGDAHKTQRDFIEAGGRQELQGSKAGKKGVVNRREVLRRKGA